MPRPSKPSRAQYGAGSVTERGPNRWQLRVSLGTGPDGKHRRVTKTVHATSRKAALAALAELHTNRHGTARAETVAGLFAEYLDNCIDMSSSTREDFEGYFRRYVPAHLKRRRIRDLTTRDLDGLYAHLQREGGRGGRPLSGATVDRLHTILHAMLEQAVRWDYIPANPAAKTREIKVVRDEVQLPPAGHLVAILAALDDLAGDGYGTPGSALPDFVALLLGSGARPGELCALPWSDVDLTRVKDGKRYGILTLDQAVARKKGGTTIKATKTNRGRNVTIPEPVVLVLEQRLARWRPGTLAAGMPLDVFPVFPSPLRPEQPWRPDSMSREFRRLRDSLDLSETLTMRNLRHYCSSVLARNGVDVITAAKRQGHLPSTMLNIYSHLIDDSDLDAADVLAANLAKVRKSS